MGRHLGLADGRVLQLPREAKLAYTTRKICKMHLHIER